MVTRASSTLVSFQLLVASVHPTFLLLHMVSDILRSKQQELKGVLENLERFAY